MNPINEFLKLEPKPRQTVLKKLNATIRSAAKNAEPAIKYGIPTYVLNGKNLVHFCGFKNHIGFFPTPAAIKAFKKELKPYKLSKGTVQLPWDKPLPASLIKKMVKFRLGQILEKN